MAVVRENILNSADVANDFLNAVVALDQTMSGLRASDLLAFVQANNLNIQMAGIDQDLSIYDIFVFWHLVAMRIPLSVGNAAHSGPIFLPWHRLYMIRLEEFMQQVTGDDTVALPYWDWAADGELATGSQWLAEVWDPAILGESRGAVRSGPLSQIRVRLVEDAQTGRLVSIDPRPLERRAGFGVSGLPDRGDVAVAMAADRYDAAPWGRGAGEHRDPAGGLVGLPGADAQPRPCLGRWRHGARHLAQRSGVLPQPLLHRPDLAGLDGPQRPGLSTWRQPGAAGPPAEQPDGGTDRPVADTGGRARCQSMVFL